MKCPVHGSGDGVSIGLAGACGSGKSTLASAFRGLRDVLVIDEPLPTALLEAVVVDARGSALPLQQERIRKRLEAAAIPRAWRLRVIDRVFDEDAAVFIPLHRSLGTLDGHDCDAILHLLSNAAIALGRLDAIVYCTAPGEVLRSRILADHDHSRPDWVFTSLGLQLELYSAWRARLRLPVLDVDTARVPASSFAGLADWIAKSACCVKAGLDCRNDEMGLVWQHPGPQPTAL